LASWFREGLPETSDGAPLVALPIPTPNGNLAGVGGIEDSIGIPATSRYPAFAAEFIKWLLSPEGSKAIVILGEDLHIPVMMHREVLYSLPKLLASAALAIFADEISMFPQIELSAQLYVAAREIVPRFLANELTEEQAVQAFETKRHELLP